MSGKKVGADIPVGIGQKFSAVEVKKEIKLHNNGHKFFLAPEAKAMTETLQQENRTRDNFYRNKGHLPLPRNPLLGDETPRGDNVRVLNLPDPDPNREAPKLQVNMWWHKFYGILLNCLLETLRCIFDCASYLYYIYTIIL